jgi:hypothetical protein
MINFSYENPTKTIFGKNAEKHLGQEVKKYGKKILLHYGGGSIKKIGLYDKIIGSLKETGIEIIELGGVVPNPRLSLVKEGIKLCKEEKIDFILAVGGGSVIDSAKAIAVGVPYEGDVWDFYSTNRSPVEALPIGVVLTIPAAGSETSESSVITKEEGGFKRSAGGECMRPQFAIMNPEVTYHLPAYQTACGVSDMLAHLMERYFTQVQNVDLTDRLIEAAMQSILHYGPIVLQTPLDYDARAEIMWAGSMAHSGLLGVGRIGDWASHDIEHELSGVYDIAHGAGLAIVFPAWMKYVYEDNLDRFVQFSTRVMKVDFAMGQREQIIQEGIHRLEHFYKRIGLPTTLKEAGIGKEYLQEMAKKAVLGIEALGQFKKLNAEDILKIYEIALG